MKQLTLLGVALLIGLFALAGSAEAAEWHSEQPVAKGIGVPAPLGEIGDIEFWAPNRGLLITPSGLYAYDGVEWHLYSTVCGGHEGRIAWAGPDDFWTVSDQQLGQELTEGGAIERVWGISLCHFQGGTVVASYGQPLGASTSYMRMDAAACSGPSDCWFAGERLPGRLNRGAFHLHWNGSALTATPSLTNIEPALEDPGRAVGALAYWQGKPYESVLVSEEDDAPDESSLEPVLLHAIEAGSPRPFVAVPSEPLELGSTGAKASEFGTLHLSSDGSRLWAAGGPTQAGSPAKPIVLRYEGSTLHQLQLHDPSGVLPEGTGISGLAAEPGTNSAWVSPNSSHGLGSSNSEEARVVRVQADGTVEPPVVLPAAGEGISPKGEAGPIACSADEQCWMATAGGWLFHLGSSLPQDADPAMHVLIASRPTDASVPLPPPAALPEDDSGSEPAKEEAPPAKVHFPGSTKKKELVVGEHQRIVHKSVLLLTFTLRVPARVRLVAKRKKKVVAATPKQTLGIGHHRLRLRLDPKRWPDDLDFEVHAKTSSQTH